MDERARIHIKGIVQGVGFRPFVYSLAGRHGLKGFCLNDSEGVVIEVVGPSVRKFIDELKSSPPPLSRIESLTVEEASGSADYAGFSILESLKQEGKSALVSPDTAICADCLKELLDPADRRYLYPFINCTNCGPRYSIIMDIPYDRPRTTMSKFKLCEACEAEYLDPANRRFHAQPNACHECGPKAWLAEKDGRALGGANYPSIEAAQGFLREGAVLAVKGLGGFHLACDATNGRAVERLRRLKRRSAFSGRPSNKPFALMSPDIASIESYAKVAQTQMRALEDRVRPIVLLEKRLPNGISGAVSPNNRDYGVMLPYTPLHHLLFGIGKKEFTALVMTSGNLSDEPIVTSNEEALSRLREIADYFLLHDRDIYMRVDDSIVRGGKRAMVLRRARGLTPEPTDLGEEMDEALACGAELKNTFTITKGRHAIMGTHIGDLENFESLEFFRETLDNMKKTFKANPSVVAHDMHPGYMSTEFARRYAAEFKIPDSRVIPVQHHHAHIASVMAESGLRQKVIGVSFDGTGYGPDGNIWGGEFLVADRAGFERFAHLGYVAMPGGDKAVKEPWRMALSYLYYAFGKDAPKALRGFFERLPAKEAGVITKMIEDRFNCPLTSSAGRLFDAVASVIGLRDTATFEAEAAMELESIADASYGGPDNSYPFEITEGSPGVVDLRPAVRRIAEDVNNGVEAPLISGRFHATVAEAVVSVVKAARGKTGIQDAVLAGGVFQNSLLSGIVQERLEGEGFSVWTNVNAPANDGGISLGQAAVAWERIKGEGQSCVLEYPQG